MLWVSWIRIWLFAPLMRAQEAIDHIMGRLNREIAPTLYYHGPHHTRDVMQSLEPLAANAGIRGENLELLRVAAAYHDCGFLIDYREHERIGCDIARGVLPGLGFTNQQIKVIVGMIMATKVPQEPKTILEEIICDADLDYLGRQDVHRIADSLYEELKGLGIVSDVRTWNRTQVKFLSAHRFHTTFARQERAPLKAAYLKEVERLVNTYID